MKFFENRSLKSNKYCLEPDSCSNTADEHIKRSEIQWYRGCSQVIIYLGFTPESLSMRTTLNLCWLSIKVFTLHNTHYKVDFSLIFFHLILKMLEGHWSKTELFKCLHCFSHIPLIWLFLTIILCFHKFSGASYSGVDAWFQRARIIPRESAILICSQFFGKPTIGI